MLLREIAEDRITYTAVLPLGATAALLRQWASENKLTLDDNPHVTVLYSRNPLTVPHNFAEHFATPIGFDILGKKLVVLLKAPTISARHNKLIKMGGSHDFESFLVHITITDALGVDLTKIKLPNFTMVFGSEYTEH